MSESIFLLGMMGAGKSSVGRELAGRLGLAFVDLDRRIESLFGASVMQLFEAGEAGFRKLEAAALDSLVAEPGFGRGMVVATGGGVVVDPRNLERMRGAGTTIYLRVPVDTLKARLEGEQSEDRPLLRGSDLHRRLAELLAARAPAYEAATLAIDAEGSVSEVVGRIEAALSQ